MQRIAIKIEDALHPKHQRDYNLKQYKDHVGLLLTNIKRNEVMPNVYDNSLFHMSLIDSQLIFLRCIIDL